MMVTCALAYMGPMGDVMVTSGPTEDQWVMMVTSAQAYMGPMGDDGH